MDGFRIGFMEECIKCGICALHCAYGALKLKTEEPSKKG
jgi:NAD-dependent dihydropyrimidine dehydrogenase PreA subunit